MFSKRTLAALLGIVLAFAAPVLCLAPTAWATTETITTTGAGTWQAPPGVWVIKLEIWGGGAAGAQMSTAGGGGGGGGGAYVLCETMAVSPGVIYDYTNGAGGTDGASPVNGGTTTFTGDGAVVCSADGAVSLAAESQTGGTGASGGTGDVVWPGGNGAAGDGAGSGGGGEGGGLTGAGASASGTTGGVGGAGGNGGDGQTVDANGNPGAARGGGSSGGFRVTGTRTGGVGGNGEIIINYTAARTFSLPAGEYIHDRALGTQYLVTGEAYMNETAVLAVAAPASRRPLLGVGR